MRFEQEVIPYHKAGFRDNPTARRQVLRQCRDRFNYFQECLNGNLDMRLQFQYLHDLLRRLANETRWLERDAAKYGVQKPDDADRAQLARERGTLIVKALNEGYYEKHGGGKRVPEFDPANPYFM